MALSLVGRFETAAQERVDHDPAFAGWLRATRSTAHLYLKDDVAAAVHSASIALQCFDAAADLVGWAVAALYYGIACMEAGSAEKARPWLEQVIAKSSHALLPTDNFARYYLARAEALLGKTAAAEDLLGAPPGIADGARSFVAEAYLRDGKYDLARKEAHAVQSSASVYARVTALAVLGRLALIEGRPAEAVTLLDRGIAEQDQGSAVPFWRSILLLSRVEALRAAGAETTARAALREAHDRIQRIASGFNDPDLRQSYLTRIEANARTVALAEEHRL